MALTNKSNIYSSSLISISYSVADNFPTVWKMMPDRAADALEKAAKMGIDAAFPVTPYKDNDTRTTQHLRDSTFTQVYRNGARGGTLYLQWRAQNPTNGFHYGTVQEFTQFENYSTPGTGPGFMEKAWSTIEQVVPELLEQEIQNLIAENAI